MGRTETFEHTADIGLRVWGDNLTDLLQTAAQGLFDYIVANRGEVRPVISEDVVIDSNNPEYLLVDWLAELIFHVETRHRLYCRFDVTVSQDERSLKATIAGEEIDATRHELDHEVKAVTRHGLIVRQEPDRSWFAELILDI
jgi:SHS2 domain-containing protein